MKKTVTIEEFIQAAYEAQYYHLGLVGKYGWAIDSNHFEQKTQLLDCFDYNARWNLIEKNNSTAKEIDEEIYKRLTKCVSKAYKEEIKNKIYELLSPADKNKIDSLFDDFNHEKYYECASTLFGLIDSEIIKFNLDDCNNGKYNISKNEKGKYESANGNELCNSTTGEPKIGQGWEALSILFKNNLKSFFNSETFAAHKESKTENGIKTTWSKEMLFDEFVNNVKKEMDKNIGYEFLNIAYPLLILFNDNDWLDYPKKPKVINRNWLAHGMYDYDDITKSDCIKLFLVYYQLIYFLETDWAAIIEDSETESTTS